jgi:hypothetical protein
MTTVRNQSYASVSHAAGAAGKLFSKAIKDTEADRKAEARKVRRRMRIICSGSRFCSTGLQNAVPVCA